MTSASCSFKTCKMESTTKTNSSCQTLTSWNPPLRNPNGNSRKYKWFRTIRTTYDSFPSQISNNLETPIIIKNSKKHSINSKTLVLFRVKHLSKIYQSMK